MSSEPRPAPVETELYYELKLMVRDRVLWRRVAIDQWAGGRLLMRREPSTSGDGVRLELIRPLEDPWTFRWYPTKDEVKLGAAVAVEEPVGDPYGTLAELLEPHARDRYSRWWDRDLTEATSRHGNTWQDRANRFWADQHRHETDEKDPLHRYPVYPFYVLGDPSGRFGLEVSDDGGVSEASIVDRMSAPWLTNGWQEWKRGSRRDGYGFWEAVRPAWEPRTYQTFTEALKLLAWSPLATRGADSAPAGYTIELRDEPGLPARIAQVLAALNPRFVDRSEWRGDSAIRFSATDDGNGGLSVIGDTGDLVLPAKSKIRYRAWRGATYDLERGRFAADEIQVYAAHEDARTIKLWIKVGYRPYSAPAP